MPLKQYHKSCARITCDRCSLYLEAEEEGMSNPLNVFIGKRPEQPEKLAKEKVLEADPRYKEVAVVHTFGLNNLQQCDHCLCECPSLLSFREDLTKMYCSHECWIKDTDGEPEEDKTPLPRGGFF